MNTLGLGRSGLNANGLSILSSVVDVIVRPFRRFTVIIQTKLRKTVEY
jgi:hypothetical protein